MNVSDNQAAPSADKLFTVPRKVVILAADPALSDGRFEEFKHGMYLGGQTRMEAAVHLAKLHPETEFIIVGGYNRPGEGQPKISDKVDSMAAFMRSHIDNSHLELVPSLPCTRHNFIALFHYLQSSNQSPEQIGVLSSSWHLERAILFAKQASRFFRLKQPMEFLPLHAETILGRPQSEIVEGRWTEYTARLEAEMRGLRQLADGSYEVSCLKNSPSIIEHVNLAML